MPKALVLHAQIIKQREDVKVSMGKIIYEGGSTRYPDEGVLLDQADREVFAKFYSNCFAHDGTWDPEVMKTLSQLVGEYYGWKMPKREPNYSVHEYAETEYLFSSVEDRNTFMDDRFPERKSGSCPGYYILPDHSSLIVNYNTIIHQRML